MLDCHGPGKAVSAGPLQVVFFQQDCARVVLKRRRRIARRARPLIIAIVTSYSKQLDKRSSGIDKIKSQEPMPHTAGGNETYVGN